MIDRIYLEMRWKINIGQHKVLEHQKEREREKLYEFKGRSCLIYKFFKTKVVD